MKIGSPGKNLFVESEGVLPGDPSAKCMHFWFLSTIAPKERGEVSENKAKDVRFQGFIGAY